MNLNRHLEKLETWLVCSNHSHLKGVLYLIYSYPRKNRRCLFKVLKRSALPVAVKRRVRPKVPPPLTCTVYLPRKTVQYVKAHIFANTLTCWSF